MEVHNVPEASDTNTFAEKIKSETFTEYHGISCFGGRKKGRNVSEIFEFYVYITKNIMINKQ